MDYAEVLEHYGAVASRLLTKLRQALDRFAAAHPELELRIWAEAQDAEGILAGDSSVSAQRVLGPSSDWFLTIGFSEVRYGIGAEQPGDAIDFSVPRGFPPLRMPVFADWSGSDRFSRPSQSRVDLGAFEIRRQEVVWQGRHWQTVDDVEVDLIVSIFAQRSLMHDSPAAAAEARPEARWIPVEGVRPRTGGQGTVWKVSDRDDANGPFYALKRLRYEKSRTSGAYRRFVKEIEITRALNHPNIVPLVDSHIPTKDDITTPFYVMPWANLTLRNAKYLRGNVEAVLTIGIQLADALAAADAEGVLHRDVKPDNVLLVGEDQIPQLADWGIGHLKEQEDADRQTPIVGDTVGPDEYTAPELRGGRLEDPDSRVDVYSLGKTLYSVLAGSRPFPLENYDDPRYDLRGTSGSVALSHFYGLLPLMVATDRNDRFTSIAQCRDALVRALDNVRLGRPYRDGMYGRTRTPSEIAHGLVSTLPGLEPAARQDIVREAVSEAVREVQRVIENVPAGPGGIPARPSFESQRKAAAEAADHFLAVGLAFIAVDEQRGLERLLATLWLMAERRPVADYRKPAANVEGAAATAALYGIALLGWYRERWTALRLVAEHFCEDPKRMVYLAAAEGHSGKSWTWVQETLGMSESLGAIDHRAKEAVPEMLAETAGLLALTYAASLPPDRRPTVFDDAWGAKDFPALYSTDWMLTLVRRLMTDPARERELAGEVFRMSVEDLKRRCAELTPAIVRGLEHRHVEPIDIVMADSPWQVWSGRHGERRRES
jgi:hypothetical protein